MKEVDQRLYIGAISLVNILPDNYHDRAVDADSISVKEDRYLSEKITEYINDSGFRYAYTIIQDGEILRFIVGDLNEEASTERGTFYYYHYAEADQCFFSAFTASEPSYNNVTDQWGTVRTIMLPQVTSGGVKYLSCVDYEISYVDELLRDNLLRSIFVSLFFLSLSVPIILIYRGIKKESWNSLRSINTQLEVSAERLELALDGADLGTWDWSIKTGEVTFNERWAGMLGYTLDEIEPHVRTWEGLVHPDDMPGVMVALTAHLEGKAPHYETEHRVRHKSGEWVWVLDRGQVTEFDVDGQPARACGTHLEITERKSAEDVRNESAARYRTLVENAPEAIVVFDHDTGLFVDANEKAEQLFGLSRRELLKLNPGDISPINQPDGRLSHEAAGYYITEAFSGNPQTFEWIHVNGKTGNSFPCEVRLVLLPSLDHTLVRASMVDITERKRVEKALKESEERYRDFIEKSLVGIFRTRISDGKFIYLNPKAVQMLGLENDSYSGIISSLELYKDPNQRQELLLRLRQDGEVHDYEVDLILKSGLTVTYSMSMKEYPDEDYIEGVVIDITERKKAEDALHSELGFATSAMESLLGPFYAFNQEGKFLRWNKYFEDIAGFSAEEMKTITALELFQGGEKRKIIKAVQQVFESGYAEVEAEFCFEDGTKRPFIFTGLRSVMDDQVCLVGMGLDITDRKNAEQERMRLHDQLRQTQKMEAIGTLAGGIAHDFNNILFAILGHADIASDMIADDDPAMECIREISIAGKRAAELTKQILTFARQAEQSRSPVQVSTIIGEVVRMLSATMPATIKITQRLNDDGSTIMADPTEIHQIMLNLCTNAGHEMMETGGEIEIDLSVLGADEIATDQFPDLRPGSYLVLSVSDTGPGIPIEDQQRIFDPFYTTKEVGQGTGMGLAVVHGIVKSLGGAIRVNSEVGQGTCFRIYLPSSSVKPGHVGAETVQIPQGTEHVLVVDDEPELGKMVKYLLERQGYTVEVFTSSELALETYLSAPDRYDVIITDQTMPRLTGAELAKKVFERHPAQPIILCTGFSHTLPLEKAKEIGIAAYLSKPVSKQDLALTIRAVLDTEEPSSEQPGD